VSVCLVLLLPQPHTCARSLYLANQCSKYFSLGKVSKDQIDDYAGRKGMSVEETERWLAPNLAYDA